MRARTARSRARKIYKSVAARRCLGGGGGGGGKDRRRDLAFSPLCAQVSLFVVAVVMLVTVGLPPWAGGATRDGSTGAARPAPPRHNAWHICQWVKSALKAARKPGLEQLSPASRFSRF